MSKESIFSDLNNLEVVSATSEKYMCSFGFTEEEVLMTLDEYQLSNKKQEVQNWYDGFTFGSKNDIYNPWSIINYIDKKRFAAYWANTSSNILAGKLIREGNRDVKEKFELLMRGEILKVLIDEQVVYNQLSTSVSSIWSLLLASGYLKAVKTEFVECTGRTWYYLALTNREVHIMFENMICSWFADYDSGYNDFITALLQDDVKAMNVYMNQVALTTFSFFDTGKRPAVGSEPERFYHGFVLGLMVELSDRYVVTSNRESGFGRYDVMLEPRSRTDDAIIIEFKVQDADEEKNLADTVQKDLQQIKDKKYAAVLAAKGIPEEKIRSYGFAFQGKSVLIGRSKEESKRNK